MEQCPVCGQYMTFVLYSKYGITSCYYKCTNPVCKNSHNYDDYTDNNTTIYTDKTNPNDTSYSTYYNLTNKI